MPSTNNKKNRKLRKSHYNAKLAKKNERSVSELVEAADHALLTEDAMKAISLYTAALHRQQQHVAAAEKEKEQIVPSITVSEILEKRANAFISISNQKDALSDFKSALSILPDHRGTDRADADVLDMLEHKAGLYLYIGQLSEGKEALDFYQKGIDCLQQALPGREHLASVNGATKMKIDGDEEHVDDGVSRGNDPVKALIETRKQLSQACCSVADLFLTDLCFEDIAEQECESYIQQALNLKDFDGHPFVDALQTAANLRLSQKRGKDAIEYILAAFEHLRLGCEALSALVGLREKQNPDEADELVDHDAVQNLPGFEFRCQTAKLLLECNEILKKIPDNIQTEASRKTQQKCCLDAAIDVLGSLLAENDEVIEIWILIGEAFAAMDPPNQEEAAHYWERAKIMLESTQQSLDEQVAEAVNEDQEQELQLQLDEVTCQLEDVAAKLENMIPDGERGVESMEE